MNHPRALRGCVMTPTKKNQPEHRCFSHPSRLSQQTKQRSVDWEMRPLLTLQEQSFTDYGSREIREGTTREHGSDTFLRSLGARRGQRYGAYRIHEKVSVGLVLVSYPLGPTSWRGRPCSASASRLSDLRCKVSN